MASNDDWLGSSGSWTDGALWSGGTEAGSTDIAIFNTGSTYTVTYDTPDTVALLEGSDSGGTLALSGGSLGLLNTAGVESYWYGVIDQSGGTLALNVGTFYDFGTLSLAGGTDQVATGAILIANDLTALDGTLAGGGEVYVNGGTATLAGSAALLIGTLDFNAGTVDLAGGNSYAGTLIQGGGQSLDLNGETLTLSGRALLHGYIDGPGAIDVTGSVDLYTAQLRGSLVLNDSGIVTQDQYIYLGGTSGDSATIDIAPTGDYKLLSDVDIDVNSSGSIINAGTFEKAGILGVSNIYADLDSTGTVAVDSGTLVLRGGSNTLDGLITGAGQLYIASGATVTLETTATLDVGSLQIQNGGDLKLAGTTATDTYAGTLFANSSATINTDGNALTLSGSGSIDSYLIGGGTLALGGTFEDGGVYLAGTSTDLVVAGDVTQSGYIQLGTTATDHTTLDIAATGTYALLGDGQNIGASGAATVLNAGLLEKLSATGETDIDASLDSTGTLDVAIGTLGLRGGGNTLDGLITGAGQLYIGSGAVATLEPTATLTVGALQIQSGGDLVLAGASLSETYTGMLLANDGGTINTAGNTLTLTGSGSVDSYLIGGGTLDLAGSFEDGGVYLSGNHTELLVTGNVTESSAILLGTTATDSTTLDVGTGVTYDVLFDGTAIAIQGAATVVNAGLIEKTAAYGNGYIEASVVNTGTVDAITGTIEFGAAVTNDDLLEAGGGLGAGPSEIRTDSSLGGTGTVAALSGGTVDFAASVASGQTVALSGSDDLVILGTPTSFAGTIDGFTTGDTIDLAGIQGTAFTYNGTILTVGIATIDAPGLTAGSIALYSDGSGGTDVEYNPSTPAFAYLSASATTDTWTGTAGDSQWSTAGNWSSLVPGVDDNVSVSSAGTITYDLTSTINVLDLSASQIDITGGLLQVDDSGSASSSTIDQSAGTLDMINGFPADGFAYTLAAGAVGEVDNGTWWIDGGSLDGTLSGSGAIELLGATTLGASLVPSVGTLILDGNETLESNLSYAGVFELIGGTLDLNGFTLTLSGTHGELAGTYTDGEIIETGSAEATFLPLDSTTALDDAGLLSQDNAGYLYSGLLTIAPTGTYDILGDFAINNNGSIGTIDNSGLFEKTAATGISYIGAVLNNAAGATLDAASGTIGLQDGGVLAGDLTGAGELEIVSGGGTLDDPTPTVATLYVGDSSGTTTLGTSIAYGGSLYLGYNATVDLAGNNLTLTGTNDYLRNIFTDTGASLSTVDVAAGATVYDGDLFVAPSVELDVFGTVLEQQEANNGITLQDSIAIEHGGVYDLISNAGIYDNGTVGTISNLGLFEKTVATGGAYIQAVFDNAGTATLDVASGAVTVADGGTFAGSIIGAGELAFTGGGTLDDATPAVGTLDLADSGGTLTLGTSVTYAGSLYLGYNDGVDLDGNKLTLTGTNDYLRNGFINSGASVSTVDIVAGATVYDGDVFVSPSVELDVFGTVFQQNAANNGITLQGSIAIETGGTYDLISDAGVYDNGVVGTLSNAGLFEKTAITGVSSILPSFTDDASGIVLVSDGTLSFAGPFGNLTNGTLTGGTYEAVGGGGIAGTLDFSGSLTDDAADIVLSGPGSEIYAGGTSIEQQLTAVDVGGSLELENGRSYLTGNTIADSGLISLTGELFQAASLDITGTGSVAGYGTLTDPTNDGVITASTSGATLLVSSPITGTGDLVADPGATLELGSSVAATQTLIVDPFGTVRIDDPVGFTGGTIGSLAPAATLDFGTATVSSASIAGGSLDIVVGGASLSYALTSPDPLDRPAIIANGTGGDDVVIYREAQATITPNPVTIGNQHVSGTLNASAAPITAALTIANTDPNDGYSENLDASISAASSLAVASGSVSGIAAGATNTTGLTLGVSNAAAGAISGTGLVTLSSDGTGVDGNPPLVIGTTDVTVTGDVYDYASPAIAGSLDLGEHHVGDTVSQALTVGNTGTAPAFTEGLDATLDSASNSDITAIGSFVNLAAGSTDTSSLVIGLNTTTAGAESATAVATLTSDGSIDGLGNTALPSQTITATGTVFNLATASAAAPNPVALGEHHVGDVVTQTFTIANTATADGFSENLNAGFTGASGVTTGGTVSELGAGSSSTGLNATIDLTSGGVFSGAATLGLISDGSTIDTLGTTALASQTIGIGGTAYNYATASVSPTSLAFGEAHVGDTVTQALTIANTAPADGFSENLDASFSGSGAVTGSGGVSGIGAGTSIATAPLTLDTTNAGSLSGSVTIGLTSDGSTIDTLGTTALAPQTIAASGDVFRLATASVPGSIDFGIVHVGDTVSDAITIANTDPADGFSENLDATAGSAAAGFTLAGTADEIGAGSSSDALTATLDTATAGTFTGEGTIGLISDGSTIDTLGTTALPDAMISLDGTVLNYATAALDEISGTGSLSGSAASGYTLDLGRLAMGGSVDTADLGALNTAIGPADTLGGSFTETGSSFSLTGFGPFGGVVAGGSADAGTINFDPVSIGTYFETITLDPTGSDPSFSGTLAPVTMLVEADVTCFLAGTRIAVPGGEVPVEALAIGDLVVTASGVARPIRWIGSRSYAGRFVAGNHRVLPILIRAGALGDNLPRRDLYVSPNHAMYLGGMLIPAVGLVNGGSIVQVERMDLVAYFHIELDTHDVLLAEGAPAESFADDESRHMFHNVGEYWRLYPDAARLPARYCAPRVEDGEELQTIRRRLASRAAAAEAA